MKIDSGLQRGANQFVAAEANKTRAILQRFSRCRLMFGESQTLCWKDRAASQVLDERNALFPRERGESCRGRRFHKTAHEKITAMNFENESRVSPNCLCVIAERRLVCRADVPHLRSGRLDNFTNAKSAAYLHHFAPRNDDLRRALATASKL